MFNRIEAWREIHRVLKKNLGIAGSPVPDALLIRTLGLMWT
jgi:hypothetical protein